MHQHAQSRLNNLFGIIIYQPPRVHDSAQLRNALKDKMITAAIAKERRILHCNQVWCGNPDVSSADSSRAR